MEQLDVSASKTRGPSNYAMRIPLAILVSFLLASSAAAQSSKGAPQANSYGSPARQPNQQVRPTTSSPSYAAQSPVAHIRQQQQSLNKPTKGYSQQDQQQHQQTNYNTEPATEDPLSDSEPALYGSVAGKPGVDFPGYTRIPKTSFTCEGKGHDFGFYADEEAQCQVYHVCWSGRRESFLCGVGTVFNQAILACDYWHSVDCSKSSQFYGVNSELGKAGAEPAANQAKVNAQVPFPVSSSSSALAGNFGDSIKQQENQEESSQRQQVPILAQQGHYGSKSANQPASPSQQPQAGYAQSQQKTSYGQNKLDKASKVSQAPLLSAKSSGSPASSPAKRPRFNVDFNQKVNSLIESPVRPPIKSAPVSRPQPPVQQIQQQQLASKPVSFAQFSPARATQNTAQNQARKTPHQQQQFIYDIDQDSDVQQQQQQTFDDSPVQTSTAQSAYGPTNRPNRAPANEPQPAFLGQQQQVIQMLHSGDASDGSSAITSQYDTLNSADQASYEPDENSALSANDDFRSSGAKAAASHNQNWYIMRTV